MRAHGAMWDSSGGAGCVNSRRIGGALLSGMPERLQHDLNLNVTVPEDPLTTVALGAGRLLTDPERLQRASLRLDAPVWQQAEKLAVNW